ncbi:MAG: hypothetical protein GXP44_03215 [bacterium]|nr:hypothetical protein [bacterium]
MKNEVKKMNTGFTLILSLLITSIVLSVGLGVFDIIFREMALSGSGMESQKAFYAADTGEECSMYWDLKHPGFTYSVFATSSDSVSPTNGVLCNEKDIAASWIITDLTPTSATTEFKLEFANGSCANIFVIKDSGSVKIESRGYNFTCDSVDPRKVERALRVSY